MNLPEALGKEPLVEAVFEVRFKSNAPTASILPGLIFAKFEGETTIEKLPHADLPLAALMRLDPNLRYAPVVKVQWQNFTILVSNQSIGLSCKSPYPGWTKGFKPAIFKLMGLVSEARVIDKVERFSLKYTNVISKEFGLAPSVVNFALKIGPNDAGSNTFQVRAEFPKDNIISIVQIASEGTVSFQDGTTKTGVLFDVDTLMMASDVPFGDFFANLSEQIETLHTEVKTIFFSCVNPDVVAKWEPRYG